MASQIHRLKLGANYQSRRFNPLALAVSERDISKEPSPEYLHSLRLSNGGGGDEVNIFTEDNISLGSGVQINLGLNYSLLISGSDKIYSTLQPRFALLADGDNLHFKIGAAKMQQYIHLLTNSGLGLPADVWLPSSNILAPQTSWIFNTSFGYRLNSGLRFGAEVYYKSFKIFLALKKEAVLISAQETIGSLKYLLERAALMVLKHILKKFLERRYSMLIILTLFLIDYSQI